MLIMEPPGIEYQYPTRRRVLLVCNTSARGVLVPLAFIFVLIGFCTLYAWKTRSVPENFNEAKFIGFGIYTTCVIWVAFLPIYFGSESKVISFSDKNELESMKIFMSFHFNIDNHTLCLYFVISNSYVNIIVFPKIIYNPCTSRT